MKNLTFLSQYDANEMGHHITQSFHKCDTCQQYHVKTVRTPPDPNKAPVTQILDLCTCKKK